MKMIQAEKLSKEELARFALDDRLPFKPVVLGIVSVFGLGFFLQYWAEQHVPSLAQVNQCLGSYFTYFLSILLYVGFKFHSIEKRLTALTELLKRQNLL